MINAQKVLIMKKRMFIGLTLFAMMFTLVAWQYASDELIEIQKETELVSKETPEAA